MGKKVAIIFGGQSSEHEVSCISACTVMRNMDSRYEQVLIGITKEGKWLLVDKMASVENGSWVNSKRTAVFSPDATKKEILVISSNGTYESIGIDVVFPVLHGLYGEDGTIQGLFELSGIPYVGCGVLASAVSMDKLYTKIIVERLGVEQAQYVEVRGYQMKKDMDENQFFDIDRIRKRIPDDVARDIIFEVSHCETATEFQNLSLLARDRTIVEIHKKGVSIRQINRLTGTPRGVVERVICKK